jgi:hypothetical protein
MNAMDHVSMNVFGLRQAFAIAGDQCVACGRAATQFRDKVSQRDYIISGLCQHCQDRFWGGVGGRLKKDPKTA